MEKSLKGGAFGWPGAEPRWARSNKTGVGTAYSASSDIWFTLWNGIVTELYHPTIDRPQIRDLQYLISDGKTFLHQERSDTDVLTTRIADHGLGYRCVVKDPRGRYTITKDIICAPHSPCLLLHTRFKPRNSLMAKRLSLYVLCAPHLELGGYRNNGYIASVNGQNILMAHKDGRWLAMAATVPFKTLSCGYVGSSDGWTDLKANFQMDYQFSSADDGNIALTGQIDIETSSEFTLGVAFGNSEHQALANLLQSLGVPFHSHLERFAEQWRLSSAHLKPMHAASGDKGHLLTGSFALLHAHEDKAFAGALIASLSIPWGEEKTDSEQGGYHLVWTRDMVNSATALLAGGDRATPLRALIYLSVSQRPDGGFAQNFYVDGEPYFSGMQLDESAFPIILAWQLHREGALESFNPINLVRRCAAFLIRNGPVTNQERWEEASGYSPSTIASNIAALICAAQFLRAHGSLACATFVEEYADYLESHIEAWMVTRKGTLVSGRPTHYIRILPEEVGESCPAENREERQLHILNRAPREKQFFPANQVVDGGFLELVRYGIRAADDPIIVASVEVIDAILKVETPNGPMWHRYNYDGYGQQSNGRGFTVAGVGRAWPLLTGERGHYELACGRPSQPYIRAMEKFATDTGLLPEQAWDLPDWPSKHLYFGRPTGSAMPLMWAHAEYLKLVRSTVDGVVYDMIPEVATRYLGKTARLKRLEVWKQARKVRYVRAGETLRVHGNARFELHWSVDYGASVSIVSSEVNSLEIDYADIPTSNLSVDTLVQFTFYWIEKKRWEGQDYRVTVVNPENFQMADNAGQRNRDQLSTVDPAKEMASTPKGKQTPKAPPKTKVGRDADSREKRTLSKQRRS